MSESILFDPIILGDVELSNRIVMAPMTRNRAGTGNVPTELNALYYAQRATAGLIITEGAQVSPQGVGYPGTPGIYTVAQVEGWRKVTDAVHERGGHIFLQLWHVGRISHSSLQPDGTLPVAPSAITPTGNAMTLSGLVPYETPRALETAEIAGVSAQFAHAAVCAKEAGFDGVEIHGANGYLIDQFLRDGSNHRTDQYGGTIENRARFLLEVTAAVVDVWGGGHVGVRLSPRHPFNDMQDSDPVRTFSYVARELNRFGLAYLHIIEPQPKGALEPASEPYVTPYLRVQYFGKLMVNGGYTYETASFAIEHGAADLVSFGSLFLANPDLPERFAKCASLNTPDRATFYGGAAQGYTDYPTLGFGSRTSL